MGWGSTHPHLDGARAYAKGLKDCERAQQVPDSLRDCIFIRFVENYRGRAREKRQRFVFVLQALLE